MSDIVIKVENLSKKYMISHQSGEKYTALRDVMANGAKRLGKKLLSPFTFHKVLNSQASNSQVLNSQVLNSQASNSQSPDSQASNSQASNSQSPDSQSPDSPFTASQEEFFALKDVSFEIKQGDRVGIIGRNGAGKSTLLKILSRITEPTSGRIEITGRVASLLEVGTGFHPELTGRENIFLNGAILGMGKAEIKRKFDEIVNFAEVERFLDTPVKRYSSGMYVRLAFAVAAHLSTDILIVDEVLAVGDAEFQKKCLTKMSELGQRENRTVIFVSHALDAISRLTNRCLVLKAGQLIFNGETSDGIKHYKDQTIIKSDNHIYENSSKKKGVVIIKCYDGNWIETERIINGECYYFEFIVRVDAIARRPIFSFQLICNTNEQPRMHAWNFEIDDAYKPGEDYKLLCKIPKIRLSKGSYNIQTWFSDHAAGHIIENMQAVGEVIVDMPSERPLFPWNVDSMAYLEEFVWLKQGNESE